MTTAPTLPGFEPPPKAATKPRAYGFSAKEYKVVCLRETPIPDAMYLVDDAEKAAAYWRNYIQTSPSFNPDVECLVTLLLDTRRRVKAHSLVSVGILDTILLHPREVYRTAIIAAASAVILMHNHPSGDPTPSEADIKVTRDTIRAGQLLKMELLDHIVIGAPGLNTKGYCSLRELGYFYT